MHYIHYILTLHALHTYIHTLHYTTLHYTTLHYITCMHITIHYNTLPYITLDYITLHTYIHIFIYIHIYLFIYLYSIPKLGLTTGLSITFCLLCARLLIFKHHFLLRSCCYDLGFRTLLLLTFQHSSLYCVCCCSALDFQILLPTTFLLLYSWLSNTTTCFFVATLSAFKHYFLLRSCCYALGFPT